jgi:hypothetical protein
LHFWYAFTTFVSVCPFHFPSGFLFGVGSARSRILLDFYCLGPLFFLLRFRRIIRVTGFRCGSSYRDGFGGGSREPAPARRRVGTTAALTSAPCYQRASDSFNAMCWCGLPWVSRNGDGSYWGPGPKMGEILGIYPSFRHKDTYFF